MKRRRMTTIHINARLICNVALINQAAAGSCLLSRQLPDLIRRLDVSDSRNDLISALK
jgi:hypothetical protein